MEKIKKATVVMDSGKELTLDESTTKKLLEILQNELNMDKQEPILINNDKGITKLIIYPKHISHIHFE